MDEAHHAAIRSAPDDDAPRLVYADALLERGDLRGELINLQCAIARGGLPRDSSLRARRRIDVLLESMGEAWAPGRLVDGYRFERGLLEEITVSADAFRANERAILDAAPFLRRARLSGLGVPWDARLMRSLTEKIAPIIDLPGMDGFEAIDAVATWVGVNPTTYSLDDKIVSWLCTSGRLARLRHLAVHGVSVLELAELTGAPDAGGLESLTLGGLSGPTLGWTDIARDALGTKSTRLRPRRLCLERTTDQLPKLDTEIAALADDDFFSHIEDLALDAFITRQKPIGLRLAGTPLLRRLRRLAYEGTMTAAEWSVLAASSELERLEELHVTQSRVGDPKKVTLGPLSGETGLASLRVLKLSAASLTPRMVADLLRSPLGQQLEVLDVRGTRAVAGAAHELRARWDGILLTTPLALPATRGPRSAP